MSCRIVNSIPIKNYKKETITTTKTMKQKNKRSWDEFQPGVCFSSNFYNDVRKK